MKRHYANVVDLCSLGRVARMIVGSWVADWDIKSLDPGRVDGDYIRITGDDPEQEEARADILSEKFGVRVEARGG